MFALLRRDPLISSNALKMGVVMALNAVVVAGLAAFLSASPGMRPFGHSARLALLAIPIWISIFPFLCFGKVAERCLPFDLALPLSARTLWLAHVIALSLFGLALLAFTGGSCTSCFLLHIGLHNILPCSRRPGSTCFFPWQRLSSW